MAEDAKKSAADEAAEQKGRAQEEVSKEEVVKETDVSDDEGVNTKDATSIDEDPDDAEDESDEDDESDAESKVDSSELVSSEEVENKKGTPEKPEIVSAEEGAKTDCHCKKDGFQAEVREQIENCKFEIISSLQESVHTELATAYDKQVRRVERRRRAGFIVRDIIILILAAIVGYFGYCLYDAQYFDFLKPFYEQNDCPTDDEPAVSQEVVKDTAWYMNSYGELFNKLKINLNADKVSAYYLYSGDYKVSEIQPNYLLAMAYNRLSATTTYDSAEGIVIPAADLKEAFVRTFGNAEYFAKRDFTYDCVDFSYDKNSDSFVTESVLCANKANRQIVEKVDEVYEEGNAMYFITTAAIYDQSEQSFYTFDNLFKPAIKNVVKDSLEKYATTLNHYQYQFKKVDNNYYFSGIVKLQ